jgi:outer membrane lipoprotein SlyB
MKRFLTAVVMAISLTPLGAFAQERVGDAALGGLSGAIVFGPVGAVAGIVVGYAAGPGISRSWGLRRSDSRYQGRAAQRPPVARSNDAELKQATAQSVSAAPAKPVSGTKRTWDSPPVMGFE